MTWIVATLVGLLAVTSAVAYRRKKQIIEKSRVRVRSRR